MAIFKACLFICLLEDLPSQSSNGSKTIVHADDILTYRLITLVHVFSTAARFQQIFEMEG